MNSFIGMLLIFLVACATQNTPEHTIKLGASLPLTGEAASIGEGAQAGIELAVTEINNAGGINGQLIEIVYEDDKCSKEGSTTLTKLVTVDQVDAIIGPICSAAGGPGLPVVQESKTPAIIFASAPHLTTGDYIFRIYPSDSFAGKFIAEYIHNLNKHEVAIVYVKNDWGQGIHDTFKQRFEELGGTLVLDESMEQDASDTRTILARIKQTDAEIIISPLYPTTALVLMKQAKEIDITVPLIGADSFETDEVILSPVAENVTYTIAALKNPDDFKARVKKTTGKESNYATSLGYDAVHIFAEIMSKVGTDKKAVRDELARVKHHGISSTIIEFDDEGNLRTANYDVKQIRGKKATILPGGTS